MIRLSIRFLFLALACLGPGSRTYADPALPAGIRACVALRADAERQACYDREVARIDAGRGAHVKRIR